MAASSNEGRCTSNIVLGVLSLIVWSLIITVTLKYVLLLLRADNNGEGGTLSLTALATRAIGRRTSFIFVLGVIGASMFLGDSMITPAISVLSAVEGLKLASPAFTDDGAADGRHPDRLFARRARYRQGRGAVRSDHGGLVRGHCGRGRAAYPRRSACALGINPFYGVAFFSITAKSAW